MSEVCPKQKALLIGISAAEKQPRLLRPHQDLALVRDLLIEQYGYEESDIVCMTDQPTTSKALRPTSANILREIDNLVSGVQPGARLFFYYSGHTTQRPNEDGSEEDGKDECIMTLTGRIVDDELHRRLIKPLCPGSKLVAFLDSCHSETLLDLPHYHCNRPWTPWINKRKGSFDIIPVAVWRISILYSKAHWRRRKKGNAQHASTSFDSNPPKDPSQMAPHRTPTESVFVASPVDDLRSFSFLRQLEDNDKENNDTENSDPLPEPMISEKKFSSRFARVKGILRPSEKTSEPHPIATHPRCRGLCNPSKEEREKLPSVVAISACKDSQFAFENDEGGTLSQVLVGILSKTPNPRLGDLIDLTSFKLYKLAAQRERSEDFRTYREENDVPVSRLNMYQHPSLASLTRLNRKERFTI